uniref:Uncharacterized protein n=1 Tax=Lupinus angustifolius TaxID=3871 RepID=L0P184_LUPAN|nr:hypothetical protein [Lupinus angustifolius]
MASSSRTKKQRINATQKNQGTSSLESNPLDLTRLLENDEQCKIFEQHFHGRIIFTPKYGNLRNFEFEDGSIAGFGLKNKKDRPPAPKPKPTHANPSEPQPYEFYVQSSSFVVMPSNQMIMDELISLRGYITNTIDAFDTQNQQIHFELHRLSSKLSSMDIDEDSSEPES